MLSRGFLVVMIVVFCVPALAKENIVLLSGKNSVCPTVVKLLNDPHDFRSDPKRINEWGLKYPAGLNKETALSFPESMNNFYFRGLRIESYYDFNNDGVSDHIFSDDFRTHYYWGTVLHVVYGKNKVPLAEYKKVDKSDIYIFPCQFGGVKTVEECPAWMHDNDDNVDSEAGVEVFFGKKMIKFRGRYTDIKPIRFGGMTYLVLRTSSKNIWQYGAVIKPQGRAEYKQVCVFKRP